MNANPPTKAPRIADGAMGRFEVPNCIVPRRFTASIEKFLGDRLTGNIKINIKDGKILGAHVEEILTFKGSRPSPDSTHGDRLNRAARRGAW